MFLVLVAVKKSKSGETSDAGTYGNFDLAVTRGTLDPISGNRRAYGSGRIFSRARERRLAGEKSGTGQRRLQRMIYWNSFHGGLGCQPVYGLATCSFHSVSRERGRAGRVFSNAVNNGESTCPGPGLPG